MDSQTKTSLSLLDLLFKGKNKDYGAYYLRKTYPRRLIQSIIALVTLSVLIIASYFIDASVESKAVKRIVKEVTLADVEDIPQDLPPPPPPPKQDQPKIEVKKFTNLILEKKENLKPEEIRPELDVEDLVDANIGVVDVEGIKTTTLAPPPAVTTTEGENYVFTKVEIAPEPNGGRAGWNRYLRRNLDASVGVDNGAPPGRYSVIVKFIVERDGRITDIKTLGAKQGFGMDEEAMRVFREAPPWTPGQQNGRSVRTHFTQKISFLVEVD